MSCITNRALLPLVVCCISVEIGLAASPAIGLAVSDGSFQLEHSRIWGNATLFEGNTIETGAASSRLQINDGVTLGLAADSRARVYRSRMVLEKGIGELGSANYPIEAGPLRIFAEGSSPLARVQMNDPKRVVVAAAEGAVRVANSQGVLVARIEAGREMAFEPQAREADAITRISGCLLPTNGKYLLVDQTTNITLQLEGAGLQAEAGNQVEITGTAETGTPTAAGASQIVHVASIKRIATGGCASAAKKAHTASKSKASRVSTGTAVAIVGGVAAVATTAGLAAAQELPGQGGSQPSTSR